MKARSFLMAASVVLCAVSAAAEEMTMAVTPSFRNSGLAEILLAEILEDTGVEIDLVVASMDEALKLGEQGDVDAVLMDSPAAERSFVAAGFGTHRREIMYADHVLVGPEGDPAGAGGSGTAVGALTAIAAAEAPFVSRGDDSGIHRRERALWGEAGIDPAGNWYRTVGDGMGAALDAAAGMDAYILTDRASWLTFENTAGLDLVFEGDQSLFNQYAYLPVSPERHDGVRTEAVRTVEDWLTSDTARALIEGYTIKGRQIFVFNARPE